MGSVSSELSLDYKLPNTTYPLLSIQKASSSSGGDPEQTQIKNIEDFLSRLEEERIKIEAFKRELPLCMQLLNSAMETYRQQLGAYQKSHLARSPLPVMEEFIPFSNMSISGTEKTPTVPSEKASWMVSAQLWSPTAFSGPTTPADPPAAATTKETADNQCSFSKRIRNGGAFLPFSKEKVISSKGPAAAASKGGLAELSLANSSEKLEMECSSDMENGGGSGSKINESVQAGKVVGGNNSENRRKARRCWSPDLHRRFVNALQMLGGSQVATPKQIRELMKVDGLTNDEVKSHLQKYRLHTRRPIPHPQPTPQLVVLGGIWVPPEYAASTAAAAGPAIYDFYTAASTVPPPHLHLHHGVPVAGPAVPYKVTIHSPEPELCSGGHEEEDHDRSEEHGRDEDSEDQEEDINKEQDDGSVNQKALVPVVDDENNIN